MKIFSYHVTAISLVFFATYITIRHIIGFEYNYRFMGLENFFYNFLQFSNLFLLIILCCSVFIILCNFLFRKFISMNFVVPFSIFIFGLYIFLFGFFVNYVDGIFFVAFMYVLYSFFVWILFKLSILKLKKNF